MYIMYVDESGDPGPYHGTADGNSRHFILSGLIVPIAEWNACFERIKEFRRRIRTTYGLALREELHAAELIRINRIDAYRPIRKADRIAILVAFIREMTAMVPCAKVVNVSLRKEDLASGVNIKALAWSRLFQRYDTFLRKGGEARGIVIADGVEDKEVRGVLRKMRAYNPIPSRYGGYYNRPAANIIEDPLARDSKHSYFVQAADAVAHVLYRRDYVKGSLRKHGLDRCFDALEPILLKEASGGDPHGVVRK